MILWHFLSSQGYSGRKEFQYNETEWNDRLHWNKISLKGLIWWISVSGLKSEDQRTRFPRSGVTCFSKSLKNLIFDEIIWKISLNWKRIWLVHDGTISFSIITNFERITNASLENKFVLYNLRKWFAETEVWDYASLSERTAIVLWKMSKWLDSGIFQIWSWSLCSCVNIDYEWLRGTQRSRDHKSLTKSSHREFVWESLGFAYTGSDIDTYLYSTCRQLMRIAFILKKFKTYSYFIVDDWSVSWP